MRRVGLEPTYRPYIRRMLSPFSYRGVDGSYYHPKAPVTDSAKRQCSQSESNRQAFRARDFKSLVFTDFTIGAYSFNITYQTLFVKWILSVSNRLPSACKADVHPFTPKTRTVSDMLIRRVFRGMTSFTEGLTNSS